METFDFFRVEFSVRVYQKINELECFFNNIYGAYNFLPNEYTGYSKERKMRRIYYVIKRRIKWLEAFYGVSGLYSKKEEINLQEVKLVSFQKERPKVIPLNREKIAI